MKETPVNISHKCEVTGSGAGITTTKITIPETDLYILEIDDDYETFNQYQLMHGEDEIDRLDITERNAAILYLKHVSRSQLSLNFDEVEIVWRVMQGIIPEHGTPEYEVYINVYEKVRCLYLERRP